MRMRSLVVVDPVAQVLNTSGAPAFVGPRKFEPLVVTPEFPPSAHAVVPGAAVAGEAAAVAATTPAAPATAVVNRARLGRAAPEGAGGVDIDFSRRVRMPGDARLVVTLGADFRRRQEGFGGFVPRSRSASKHRPASSRGPPYAREHIPGDTMTLAPALLATRRRIRVCLAVVVAGLVVSGVTAFPLREELALARDVLAHLNVASILPGAVWWVDRVAEGLDATAAAYPFIAYGTDWLAFAHLLIAVAFVGPLVDPVRNIWVIVWGLIACAGILPLAAIAGGIRGLPLGWQLIDMSFGVVAAVPLVLALVWTRRVVSDIRSTDGVRPGSSEAAR
jgi:hypothetical protein